MSTFNTGNPLGSTSVRDLYDNAENLDLALNGTALTWVDRLGVTRQSYAGFENEFDSFMSTSQSSFGDFMTTASDQFDQFLASSGYQDLGDYAAGLEITAYNQVFRRDGELYRASASLELPYTTTGNWEGEGASFVSVGDGALRQMLSSTDADKGPALVRFEPAQHYPIGTAGYQIEGATAQFLNPPVQATTISPAISYSDNDYTDYVDSFGDALYRHSPRIVQDVAGRYHMVYSRGRIHGFGGFSEANAIDPQSVIVYVNSWDLRNWSPEHVLCSALPADEGLNPFRSVFDCIIGITQSGRIVVAVSDIPPPSSPAPGGWGRYTGNTKYRLFTNDHRGAALGPDGSQAWKDRGVFWEHTEDYARIYCGNIKIIPKIGGGTRMAFADYRRTSTNPTRTAVGMFYCDDEFETFPVRGADAIQSNGNNESDFDFQDALHGMLIARGNCVTSITDDGGRSWTVIGNSSNFVRTLTAQLVSPILKAVRIRGTPCWLLGWSERGTSSRYIRWSTTTVQEMRAFRTAVATGQQYSPWTVVSQSGPPFSGSGGYHSPIIDAEGSCVYVDVTETSADPQSGLMRAQLRVVRFSVAELFPHKHGQMLGSARTWMRQYNEDENLYRPRLIGTIATGTGTATVVGTNTRTGNRCDINGTITLTGLSGFAGSLRIDGLPYHSMDGLSQLVQVEVTSAMASSWNPSDRVAGLVIGDTNYIALYKKVATTQALVGLQATDLGTSFSCHIVGNYKCRFPGDS